jgi:hypothetical protein
MEAGDLGTKKVKVKDIR